MDKLISAVLLSSPVPSAVFLDAGATELLKWAGGDASPNVLLLSLSFDGLDGAEVDSWMRRHKPLRGVFVVSSPIRDILPAIKRQCVLFNFGECAILTSSTMDSTLRPNEVADLGEPYAFVRKQLRPTKSSIRYFPLHSIPVLRRERYRPASVELSILACPAIRTLFPLTLGSLDLYHSSPSVHSVEPGDVPFGAKLLLRCAAHELAGALVHDLGVDAESHIFTLGKTASFVGHSMQPIISTLTQQREALLLEGQEEEEAANEDKGRRGRLSEAQAMFLAAAVRGRSKANAGSAALERATLLLIDRTEDLFTPSAHGPSPLAHRALCALARARDLRFVSQSDQPSGVDGRGDYEEDEEEEDEEGGEGHQRGRVPPRGTAAAASEPRVTVQAYPLIDVSVRGAAATSALGTTHSPSVQPPDPSSRPLSAMAGLATWVVEPSLCLSSCETDKGDEGEEEKLRALYHSVCVGSEEEARSSLVAALRAALARHGRTEPAAKRRGLGAEVLAFAQALLGVAPGGKTAPSLQACVAEQPLLTLCGAVVETMQRSAKPPPPSSAAGEAGALPAWRCGFDVRSARERALEDILQARMSTFAECVPFLLSFLQPQPQPQGQGQGQGQGEDQCAGPPDAAHLLLMAVRALSVLGLQGRMMLGASVSDSPWTAAMQQDVGMFARGLAAWLGSPHASLSELRALAARGLMPETLVEDLATSRGDPSSSSSSSAASVDDSWSDDEGDGAGGGEGEREACERRARLQLDDLAVRWQQRLLELGSSLRCGCDDDGQPRATVDVLAGLKARSRTGGGEAEAPLGVVALAVRAMLQGPENHDALQCFTHVETPLQQLKRAGLGLLSHGLSFFGSSLAPPTPSRSLPTDNSTVVIAVLGGISFREARQVQQLIDAAADRGGGGLRVMLLSNRLVGGEDAIEGLLT
jgi:hypothetical protein